MSPRKSNPTLESDTAKEYIIYKGVNKIKNNVCYRCTGVVIIDKNIMIYITDSYYYFIRVWLTGLFNLQLTTNIYD